jgi:hypothetical protein
VSAKREVANCTSNVQPNVFGYVENGTAWEVRQESMGDAFADMFVEFQDVAREEKQS